jgi:Protein of unknown function (DUF2501)
MKDRTSTACVVAGIAALVLATNASSQDLGALKSAAGGMDVSSLASGSAGNAAGILEYCMKNNYLGGDAASSMKDKLIGKVGGEDKAKEDSGYMEGAKGMLMGGDGKSTDLTSLGGGGDVGGMKSKLTEKACGAVLDNAKSLL